MVSDRIVLVFSSSGTTQAVVLDISKAFNRVYFRSGWFKSSQEYQFNAGVIKVSFLVLHFSCYTFDDSPDAVICNILPSGAYVTLYMRDCSHCEMRENKRHLSCGFPKAVNIIRRSNYPLKFTSQFTLQFCNRNN